MCSIGNLHTHWKFFFFAKMFYNFFSPYMKSLFCINSKKIISTIHRCCQKTLFISVKYLKMCISKSFMRPRFLFTTLYLNNICMSTICFTKFSDEGKSGFNMRQLQKSLRQGWGTILLFSSFLCDWGGNILAWNLPIINLPIFYLNCRGTVAKNIVLPEILK